MKGLILAAGFGTRMSPITDSLPKPLIPVLNIPVIEYNLHLLRHAGIKEIYINLHHHANLIEEHLGSGSRHGVRITYLREDEILGTGGAIGSLKGKVDETFVVINSDTIFNFPLEEMIDYHKLHNPMVTLGVVPASSDDPRSVVTVDNNRVIRMLDKAFYSPLPEGNVIFTGLHIIEPRLLEYIPSGIFLSITDYVYSRMVEERQEIKAFKITGDWWDMGTPDDFFKCSFDLLDRMPLPHFDPFKQAHHHSNGELRENLVVMGKGAMIPAVPVNPPVILGDRVSLKRASRLGPNLIIGNNVKIDREIDFTNAIFLPNSDGERVIKTQTGTIYY